MLDHAPRDVHLRNTPCPECGARQYTRRDDTTGERMVFPAIKVDFADGLVRAAECQACGHAWFRGEDLESLAAVVNPEQLSA
jgi:hypothetical protein